MDEADTIEIDSATARAVLIAVLRQYTTPTQAICIAWNALIGSAEVADTTSGKLIVRASDIGKRIGVLKTYIAKGLD